MESHRRTRRLLALLAALLFILALEGLVRAAEWGSGRRANEFFSGRVYERAGEVYHTRPARGGFFLAQEFAAQKPAGTVRIFILGGSTAMGFPFAGGFGMRELLALAQARLEPRRRVEIINAAGYGYGSHRVAAVAEEVLRYSPDALVVMTGHNEFLERRTGGPWNVALVRLGIGLARRLRGRADVVQWEAHDVDAAEREFAERRLRANLGRIARRANKAGVKVIFVTCPSNLRDYRPFGASAIPAAEQRAIDRDLVAGRLSAVEGAVERWRPQEPGDAWLDFAAGMLRSRAGDQAAAIGFWTRARDEDPRPVRATTRLNEVIRAVAGPDLADADREFAAAAALPGAPGDELFFDHCHPREAGQQVLAVSVLRALLRAGLVNLPDGWEEQAAEAWKEYSGRMPAEARAQGYYRVAAEAGLNMERPRRGLRLAREALDQDPRHEKARLLSERLWTPAQTALTGD